MFLQFEFEQWFQVSIGSQPDQMRLEFIEPKLFSSKTSGLSIEDGKYVFVQLPQHFPDEETFIQVEIISDAIVKVSESAFWSSLLIAVLISLSLKVMWNIMNVMQVLAYTRLFSLWPANIKQVMDAIQLAITMDVFYARLTNWGLD